MRDAGFRPDAGCGRGMRNPEEGGEWGTIAVVVSRATRIFSRSPHSSSALRIGSNLPIPCCFLMPHRSQTICVRTDANIDYLCQSLLEQHAMPTRDEIPPGTL